MIQIIGRANRAKPNDFGKSYRNLVKKMPRALNWLDNSIKLSNELITDPSLIDYAAGILKRHVATNYNLSEGAFADADVKFKSSEHTKHVTDEDLTLPNIVFRDESSYRIFMARIGYPRAPQGVSIQTKYSPFLKELGIRHDLNSRPLRVSIYSAADIVGMRPADQIRRHEDGHKFDPLLEERILSGDPNYTLLGELTAVFAEGSSPERDRSIMSASAGFWAAYLVDPNSKSLLKFLQLSDQRIYSRSEIAEAMESFVKKLSRARSNTKIMKVLMSSKSFTKLYENIYKAFPGIYPIDQEIEVKSKSDLKIKKKVKIKIKETESPRTEPRISISERNRIVRPALGQAVVNSGEALEQVNNIDDNLISVMSSYYRGYKEFYSFEPRSITFTHENAELARRALSIFMSAESQGLPGDSWIGTVAGTKALKALSQISSFNFETRPFMGFDIQTSITDDEKVQIKVEW